MAAVQHEVAYPPEVVALVVVSVVSGGFSLVAFARFLLPGLPLLTRTAGQAGDHPVRRALLTLVATSPGILLSTLRQQLQCSAGTIQHHLSVLERQGLVRCVRGRRRCNVFPATVPMQDRGAMAALARGRARDLARTVLLNPGLPQKDLTDLLGMSRRTARRHLDDLVALGLVVEQEMGRGRTYLPSPALGSVLSRS